VLSSCSTFDPPAATVGGSEISESTVEQGLDGFESALPRIAEAVGITQQEGSGIAADTGRLWVGYLVKLRIAEQTLTRLGGSVTDADRLEGQQFVEGDADLSELATPIQTAIIQTAAVNTALRRVTTVPTPAEMEARYAANPASTGALCVRHILVGTQGEAREILAELADGADFATIAAARSLDTGTGANGGALTAGDRQCFAVHEVAGSIDPGFLQGALAARVGVPTEPVRSSFGWHIILARPWAEIGDGVLTAIRDAPGLSALYADYVTTPVSVASKYGRWDALQQVVVPLS